MRFDSPAARRPALWLAAAGSLLIAPACSPDHMAGPRPTLPGAIRADVSTAGPNLAIVEVMADPSKVADASGEYIKLYNPGPVAVDLQNYRVLSGSGTTVYTGTQSVDSHTIGASITVPVGACVVIGNNVNAATNGGVTEAYSWGTSIALANNNVDWVEIKSAGGALLDSVAYSASTVSGSTRTIGTPALTAKTGIARIAVDPSVDHVVMAGSNWRDAATTETYGAGDRGTPNSCGYTWRVTGGVIGVPTTAAINPAAASVARGQTTTLVATASDAHGNAVTAKPADFDWTTSDDKVATVDAGGVVTGIVVSATPVTITATLKSDATIAGTAQVTVVAPPSKATVSARPVPLPVGYQTQLFAGGTDFSGNAISGQAVVWASSDEKVLTVDQRGVITAAGVGTAKISITAPDGSVGETTVGTESQFFSSTARAGHNTELGLPADADASDDVIITRKQYTISWNPSRGGPNWVSWDLSASHIGNSDRCNCFTADTALARLGHAAQMYTTADYIAGGQWDRGHMEPSADQTTTDTENGATFFLTNILPQRHDLNAGPWEKLEIALRDSAKAGREVYQIAGGIFTGGVGLGTLNDSGRIAIPDATWKIAVIMPANQGLADVTSPQGVTVIAVSMPNVTGIISNGWEQYRTTVAALQRSTGYDFLSLVPEQIQCRLETRNCAPIAAFGTSGTLAEGSAASFDAGATTDADGDALTYAWSFGDGSTAIGAQTTHAYAVAGSYQVTLTVDDGKGGSSTVQHMVTIANVPPTVASFAGASLLLGETYAASGSFGDPGADAWTATVDYGDGNGVEALPLSGFGFALSHRYAAAGSYTVTVRVADGHGGVGTRSAQVIVETAAQGIDDLLAAVRAMPARNRGQTQSLDAKLDAASAALARGEGTAASSTIGAFENELDAMVQSGRLDATTATSLTTFANRVIASIANG